MKKEGFFDEGTRKLLEQWMRDHPEELEDVLLIQKHIESVLEENLKQYGENKA